MPWAGCVLIFLAQKFLFSLSFPFSSFLEILSNRCGLQSCASWLNLPIAQQLWACFSTPSVLFFRHSLSQLKPKISLVSACHRVSLRENYERGGEWRSPARLRSCSRSSPARCVWSCSAIRWSSSADTTSARCASSSAGKRRRTSFPAVRSVGSRVRGNCGPTRCCAT